MDEKILHQIANQSMGHYAASRILRFSNLNPEQKLAHVLEMLITVSREKLALTEICVSVAAECRTWKETPEGQAWVERKKKSLVAHSVPPLD